MAIFGCGGATAPEDAGLASEQGSNDEAGTSPTPDGRDAAVAPSDTGRDAATPDAHPLLADSAGETTLACPGAPVSTKGPVTKDTFQCCATFLNSELSDAGELSDLRASSSSSKECCNAIIAYVDQDHLGAFDKVDQVLGTCCDRAGRPEGPACTPWGPPVPPSMSDLEVA